jgi:hypothetical protein
MAVTKEHDTCISRCPQTASKRISNITNRARRLRCEPLFTPLTKPNRCRAKRGTFVLEEKLVSALRTVLHDPEVAGQMERGGTIPRWLSPDDLKATMEQDEARWAAVIRAAGIKVE